MNYSGRPYYPIIAFAVLVAVLLPRLASASQSYSATTDSGQLPPARIGASAREAMTSTEYAAIKRKIAQSPMALMDSPSPFGAVLYRLSQTEKRVTNTLASIERKQVSLQEQFEKFNELQQLAALNAERIHSLDQRLTSIEAYETRREDMPASIAAMKTQMDMLVKVTAWAGVSFGGLFMTSIGFIFRRSLCANVCVTKLRKVLKSNAA